MLRSVKKSLRRLERLAADGTDRAVYRCEISPAGGAELRERGFTKRRAAIRAGEREENIENAAEDGYSIKSQISNYKSPINP
jgi:hypothetical protein